MSNSDIKKVLTNRNFLLVWFAQIISVLGSWTYYVAITALMYDLTQSGIGIAKLRSVQTVALLLMAPIVGVFVDRLNRKKIMIFSDLLRSFILLIFIFFRGNFIIYLVGVSISILNSFFNSSESSIIPDLVDKDELVIANSLTSTTGNLMLICGGALGGIIVAVGGYEIAFIIDLITYLISAILLLFIKGQFNPQIQDSYVRNSSLYENLKSAFKRFFNDISYCIKYLRKEKEIVAIILMFFLLSFGAGAVNVLSIVFANQILKVGSKGYGFLLTIQGLGSLIASFCMVFLSRRFKPVVLFNTGFLMMGLSMALLGLTKYFPMAGLLFFVSGFGNVLFIVPSVSVLQKLVHKDLRGRVFSFQYIASESALLLGMLITGLLEGIVDIRIIISAGGLFETLGAIISILFFISLANGRKDSIESLQS
ncbi:MAG: MFS transporter [Halanaerobiales bacterium]|nr:MFS transporter [Halanaerobiales bacterium]